jgi:membrane fusion protein, multidrug efflux system
MDATMTINRAADAVAARRASKLITSSPTKMRRCRAFYLLPGSVLSCVALILVGCADRKVQTKRAATTPLLPVEVATVERRDLVETLNLVGSVAATESAQVRAEIAGIVREIAVEEGQAVKKGQLLVKIDDGEISAQAEEAASTFQLAELNLRRAENLAKTNNVAQADRDRAEAEFRGAKAKLALQRSRWSKTEIRAPFDGVVGARAVSPGDYVSSQSIITTIDDLSRLKIDFEVPERFLRQVKPGTAFQVKPAGAAAVSGSVFFVSSAIARETRSSMVKGFLASPPPDLKPGMFANVELVLDVHKGVLVVPESAILVSSSGTQIVVARKNGEARTADFVPVRLGLRSKGFVEITPLRGELEAKEPVVASGVGAITLFQDAKLEVRPLRKELQLVAEE